MTPFPTLEKGLNMPKGRTSRDAAPGDVKAMTPYQKLILQERGTDLDSRIQKFGAMVTAVEMAAFKYQAFDSPLSKALIPRLSRDGLESGKLNRLLRNIASNKSGFLRTKSPLLVRVRDAIMLGEIAYATLYLPGTTGGGGGTQVPPSSYQNWPWDMTGWIERGVDDLPDPRNGAQVSHGATYEYEAAFNCGAHTAFYWNPWVFYGPAPAGLTLESWIEGSSISECPIDWTVDRSVTWIAPYTITDPVDPSHNGERRGVAGKVWDWPGDDAPFVEPPWIGETEGDDVPGAVVPLVLDPWESHPLASTSRTNEDIGRRRPDWKPRQQLSVDTAVGGAPVLRVGSPPVAPPGARVRERKVIANVDHESLVGFLINQVTEGLDALDALFDAMPDDGKPGYYRLHGKRGRVFWKKRREATPQQKFRYIYDNYDRLDVKKALENIAVNQIEDAVIGGASKRFTKAMQPVYRQQGSAVGFMTGPAM